MMREMRRPIGAEIWEGDERRKFQFLESTDSLNHSMVGPLQRIAFLVDSLPMPSFTECLDPIQRRGVFLH